MEGAYQRAAQNCGCAIEIAAEYWAFAQGLTGSSPEPDGECPGDDSKCDDDVDDEQHKQPD